MTEAAPDPHDAKRIDKIRRDALDAAERWFDVAKRERMSAWKLGKSPKGGKDHAQLGTNTIYGRELREEIRKCEESAKAAEKQAIEMLKVAGVAPPPKPKPAKAPEPEAGEPQQVDPATAELLRRRREKGARRAPQPMGAEVEPLEAEAS